MFCFCFVFCLVFRCLFVVVFVLFFVLFFVLLLLLCCCFLYFCVCVFGGFLRFFFFFFFFGRGVLPVGVGFCCVVCFNHYCLGFRRADSFGGGFFLVSFFVVVHVGVGCCCFMYFIIIQGLEELRTALLQTALDRAAFPHLDRTIKQSTIALYDEILKLRERGVVLLAVNDLRKLRVKDNENDSDDTLEEETAFLHTVVIMFV